MFFQRALLSVTVVALCGCGSTDPGAGDAATTPDRAVVDATQASDSAGDVSSPMTLCEAACARGGSQCGVAPDCVSGCLSTYERGTACASLFSALLQCASIGTWRCDGSVPFPPSCDAVQLAVHACFDDGGGSTVVGVDASADGADPLLPDR